MISGGNILYNNIVNERKRVIFMSFNNIRELLQANPLRNDLVVGTGDGRLDSALSETVVIDHLKNNLTRL